MHGSISCNLSFSLFAIDVATFAWSEENVQVP